MTCHPQQIGILVNLSANDGKAEQKWALIEQNVYQYLGGEVNVHTYRPPEDTSSILTEWVNRRNVRFLISAGGDGSLNYLVNQLMDFPEDLRQSLTIGCIGLGSSNDALKPVRQQWSGIPVHLDLNLARIVDLGSVTIGSNPSAGRYFLNNASLGVTADANAFFNREDIFIRWTKKRWTQVAIFYAAIKTILQHQNFPSIIEHDQGAMTSDISSISILKTPYLAGSLKYDQDVARDDGILGLNLCDNMNRIELIRTVMKLMQGKFTGRPKCVTLKTTVAHIRCKQDVNIEIDGEIYRGRDFWFKVCPASLRFIC